MRHWVDANSAVLAAFHFEYPSQRCAMLHSFQASATTKLIAGAARNFGYRWKNVS